MQQNPLLQTKHLLVEDWSALLELLERGNIRPIVAATFHILEAANAYELLASGQVGGNVVLITPESP